MNWEDNQPLLFKKKPLDSNDDSAYYSECSFGGSLPLEPFSTNVLSGKIVLSDCCLKRVLMYKSIPYSGCYRLIKGKCQIADSVLSLGDIVMINKYNDIRVVTKQNRSEFTQVSGPRCGAPYPGMDWVELLKRVNVEFDVEPEKYEEMIDNG